MSNLSNFLSINMMPTLPKSRIMAQESQNYGPEAKCFQMVRIEMESRQHVRILELKRGGSCERRRVMKDLVVLGGKLINVCISLCSDKRRKTKEKKIERHRQEIEVKASKIIQIIMKEDQIKHLISNKTMEMPCFVKRGEVGWRLLIGKKRHINAK